MTQVTPIDGFMTTDGTFFPTEIEAIAHQHAIDITPEVEAYLKYDGRFRLFEEMHHILRWEEHKKFKELGGE